MESISLSTDNKSTITFSDISHSSHSSGSYHVHRRAENAMAAKITPKLPRKLTIIALPVLSLPPASSSTRGPIDPLKPYLPKSLVLHPRFLKPVNPLEKAAITSGYITRKWRYRIWDLFWTPFEDAVGSAVSENRADPITKWTWNMVNKLTTRKGATEEWVLRGIPAAADEVEVQYPVLDESSEDPDPRIPTSILTPLLLHLASPPLQSRMRTRLALHVAAVPLSVLLAKVVLPVAQLVLCYNLFGIASSWRAISGGRRLQELFRAGKVRYVGNPQLGQLVTKELETRWKEEKAAEPTLERPTFCWGDLDRGTVENVEREMKIYELGRTYERARRIGMWKGEGVRAS
jgi:hypothetical protein